MAKSDTWGFYRDMLRSNLQRPGFPNPEKLRRSASSTIEAVRGYVQTNPSIDLACEALLERFDFLAAEISARGILAWKDPVIVKARESALKAIDDLEVVLEPADPDDSASKLGIGW
jgi:hypothetical protein